MLTARCENYLHGRPDLADTIARLQAYQAAGADVLYAPGVQDLDDIRAIVAAVDLPINVLARPEHRTGRGSRRRGRAPNLGRRRIQSGRARRDGHGRTGISRTRNLRILESRGRGRRTDSRRLPLTGLQSWAMATAGAPLVKPAADPWNSGPNVKTPPSAATNR